MKVLNLSVVFALSLFWISGAVLAETPQEKGLRISKEVEKFNEGFIGEESQMEMILIDAQGNQVVRKLTTKVKEFSNDGDRSLSVFQVPKDVSGVKMLTWSHKKEDDDQWLFMPKLRKVRQIASSNKDASFLGSEFSYEDLGSQEIEKYTYKFISEKKDSEHQMIWVVEQYPVSKKSGYKKQVVHISKKLMNAIRVEYHNRRGDLLKVGTFEDFKPFTVGKKQLFRASRILMDNKLTKKKSILNWKKRELGKKFSDLEFKKESLKESF